MNSGVDCNDEDVSMDRNLRYTVQVLPSYVSKNDLKREELISLMKELHMVIEDLSESRYAAPDGLTPAVPIRDSVTDDYLICLEDGRRFKSLKRHLRSKYDMTPDAYRDKWGLPDDYPMVAPSYAQKRSRLAREMGLGKSSS